VVFVPRPEVMNTFPVSGISVCHPARLVKYVVMTPHVDVTNVPFGSVVTAARAPFCHCHTRPLLVDPDVSLNPRAPDASAHHVNRRMV